MKRTGILLYRGNLNKGKIYTRRIFNTDRKSLLWKEEKVEVRLQMNENVRIYRKKFTVQIVQRTPHLL